MNAPFQQLPVLKHSPDILSFLSYFESEVWISDHSAHPSDSSVEKGQKGEEDDEIGHDRPDQLNRRSRPVADTFQRRRLLPETELEVIGLESYTAF